MDFDSELEVGVLNQMGFRPANKTSKSIYFDIEKCKNDKEARAVGVEWGIQQAKELKDAGVPVLHFYSMGKSDSVRRIAEAIF